MARLNPNSAGQILAGFHGHEEFCRESLSIRNKAGVSVPLILTPAQQKLNLAIKRQIERQVPVRIVVLKARQVHMSVGVASQGFRRVAFAAGAHARGFWASRQSARERSQYI